MDDFAVFILTHGRPNSVKTIKTLKKCGYTGKVFIVIDDEDDTAAEYIIKYGDKVKVFSKEKISKTFDEADNFKDRRSIVYARNACFDIAKDIGIKYFMQLDDDYTRFEQRFDENLKYIPSTPLVTTLDSYLASLLQFFKKTNILSIAIAQGGDFIGGSESGFAKQVMLKRKCMNTFICSTDRRFNFIGRINEDVNTYTNLASQGGVFFTLNQFSVKQAQTQKTKGGMTDIYLENGTYVKSFYSIIFMPSAVKIGLMGNKKDSKRLHHKIKWNNCVPKIIAQKYKK